MIIISLVIASADFSTDNPNHEALEPLFDEIEPTSTTYIIYAWVTSGDAPTRDLHLYNDIPQ